MRSIVFVLGALLLALMMAPAFAQSPFADVPTDHWAYNAVNDLAEKGLLEGYPDGMFKGKQALTRYEFAQAIARIMDKLSQMGGIAGPAGPPGPPGAAGSGAGLTPEQQALLDKLAKEFGPELKALRSDLDALTGRVEDLEAMAHPAPKVTVDGSISFRTGVYGTGLGFNDVASTGYPWFAELYEIGEDYLLVAPYGGINVPNLGSFPVSDALKDSFKAGDFMTLKTKVNFNAALSDAVNAKVTLLAGPETNETFNTSAWWDDYSPLSFTGNGIMDTVAVDEAWVKYRTKFVAPVEFTIGKQYFSRGQGLLVDNNQESIKAFKADWTSGDFGWGLTWGMFDREQFWGYTADYPGLPALDMYGAVDPETCGQDNYDVYTLDWKFLPDWKVDGTYLASGFNEEKGWSASLNGKAFGLDLYGEYANLLKWPNGDDFVDNNADGVEDANELPLSDSDTAWLAGLKWGNNFVNLKGEYGEVDAGYAIAFTGGGWSPILAWWGYGMYNDYFNLPLSRLHPNAEVDPHDINWVDRPLFLDPTNIARGWNVNVTFPTLLGEKTPLSISYMTGDAYCEDYLAWLGDGGSTSGNPQPDKWRDADPVLIVKLSRQFTENVGANLIYGRREAENVLSPQDVEVPGTQAFAENDPIQVIRAEVCVSF